MKAPSKLDLASVEAVLRGLALPMGLVIDKITVTGTQLHLEKEPFKVVMPQPGRIEVLIIEDSLATFLNKEAPGGLRDFDVQLKDGKVYVQASMRMIVDIRASAVCTLRIQDGKALYVDLETVDVMGVGAKNLVQSQLEKINPVLDASEFPVDVTLTDYEIASGKLFLRGEVLPKE